HNKYTCFLSEKTTLPMMYMPDAIKATIQIMQTDSKNIKVRSSYNIAGCSFNPLEISTLIKSEIPNFTIDYNIDFRQEIADSWPQSIDDSSAKLDWKWEKEYNLNKMTADMMGNLKNKYNLS
ncbi:NAD-dependent epimerase, partial [Flavobacteriales bacterium]|nr:NAD-dependent epimerase [Flavobacteriales bacterium]